MCSLNGMTISIAEPYAIRNMPKSIGAGPGAGGLGADFESTHNASENSHELLPEFGCCVRVRERVCESARKPSLEEKQNSLNQVCSRLHHFMARQ